jgi:hypothetical protein
MAQDRSLPPLTALQAFHAAGRKGSFEAAARACGHTLGHQSSDPRTRTVARQATVPAPGPTRGAHSRRSRLSQGGGSVIRASPHCGRSPEGGGEYPDDATHQRAAAIHERLADPAA